MRIVLRHQQSAFNRALPAAFARGKQENRARADFSSSFSAMAAVVVLNSGS